MNDAQATFNRFVREHAAYLDMQADQILKVAALLDGGPVAAAYALGCADTLRSQARAFDLAPDSGRPSADAPRHPALASHDRPEMDWDCTPADLHDNYDDMEVGP